VESGLDDLSKEHRFSGRRHVGLVPGKLDMKRIVACFVVLEKHALPLNPVSEETLGRLARADPDDLPTRKKLAQIALAKQDFASAADWANQALEIDVTDAEVHRMFAEAMAGRHNYLGAIEEFQAAIELAPEDPRPRSALAQAYLEAHNTREARRVLNDLLRRDPDNLEARSLLEGLEEKEEP